MNINTSELFVLAIPFMGTTLGAAMVFLLKDNIAPKLEKLLLGFASGVMIAASVWSLLIPSIDMQKARNGVAWLPALVGFLVGIAFLLLLDTVIPHLHLKSTEPEGISVKKGHISKTTMMLFAVTLHNIPEGMSVGVAYAGAALQGSGISTAAAFALVSLNVSGQDLLARQAPIDRKLKAVDSVALIRQIKAEKAAYPAYTLYPNWSNERVHAYGNTVTIPDTFRIDMTGFHMPTEHTKITSKFGPRRRRMHNGLDIKVYIGDTIRAAFSGKVRMVKYERRGYGKYVVIRHENGLETVYGHLSKQIVNEDQYVEAGEPIGLGGNTGRSTGSHLHFETRFLGQAINPALLFDFEKQDIVADSYLFRKGNNRYRRNNTSSKNVSLMASSDGTIRYHKVRSGDTLSRIAQKTGTSIDALCKLNHITRRTILRPGQVLRCS